MKAALIHKHATSPRYPALTCLYPTVGPAPTAPALNFTHINPSSGSLSLPLLSTEQNVQARIRSRVV